jgi:hypothetical protein
MDGGSLPALRSHLWLAGAEAERTAQSLRCDSPSFGQAARGLTLAPACSPLLTKMRKGLSELLRDVVTLEVALSRKTEAHILVRRYCFCASRPCAGVCLCCLTACSPRPGSAIAVVLELLHSKWVAGRSAPAGRQPHACAVSWQRALCALRRRLVAWSSDAKRVAEVHCAVRYHVSRTSPRVLYSCCEQGRSKRSARAVALEGRTGGCFRNFPPCANALHRGA